MKAKEFPSLEKVSETKILSLLITCCKVAVERVLRVPDSAWRIRVETEVRNVLNFFIKKGGIYIYNFHGPSDGSTRRVVKVNVWRPPPHTSPTSRRYTILFVLRIDLYNNRWTVMETKLNV